MSVQRVTAPVITYPERFALPPTQSTLTQYSGIYTRRLAALKEQLVVMATERWPDVRIVDKIIDCELNPEVDDAAMVTQAADPSESEQKDFVVIGTLYKEMHLRQSVLDEYRDNNGVLTGVLGPVTNYASKEDKVLLEDESGRIVLEGEKVDQVRRAIVTGVVPALRGHVTSKGAFRVEDILFAGSGLKSVPRSSPVEDNDLYVVLVSGLRVGSAQNDTMALQLLADYIGGRAGGERGLSVASRIVRVVVAGELLCAPETSKRKYGKENSSERLGADGGLTNYKQLDVLLSDILTSCPVDVMPGASDPATIALPQQPLHHCLLPNASRFSTYSAVSNPYEVCVGGRVLLGTSGQPVQDVLRQTMLHENDEPELDALASTLLWGHVCPTAPDTLSCHPLTVDDPFVISQLNPPDIFFAGNQSKYAARTVTSASGFATRVVCVPDFYSSQEVVLVNLRDLQTRVVSFRTFSKA